MGIHLDEANLGDFLCGIGIADPGEPLTVEPAGDGNINWVRRVRREAGRSPASWIVKQARPALERFPEYEVTTERIVFEHRFYEAVGPLDATRVCPVVHAFAEEDRTLVLEDLGDAPRLDHTLARGEDAGDALVRLASFLGALHAGTRDPALAERFRNGEMQGLHGDHIFHLPLRPHEFPMEAPVAERARALWNDAGLVAIADAAYARYREPQGALLHGDVQAGNVLLTPAGPKLLDAEIAHFGDPAFDLGQLLAHSAFPRVASGELRKAEPGFGRIWEAYREAHGAEALPAYCDASRYAGLEMMRRTIGAARVDATATVEGALNVLDVAVRWIREPPAAP